VFSTLRQIFARSRGSERIEEHFGDLVLNKDQDRLVNICSEDVETLAHILGVSNITACNRTHISLSHVLALSSNLHTAGYSVEHAHDSTRFGIMCLTG